MNLNKRSAHQPINYKMVCTQGITHIDWAPEQCLHVAVVVHTWMAAYTCYVATYEARVLNLATLLRAVGVAHGR